MFIFVISSNYSYQYTRQIDFTSELREQDMDAPADGGFGLENDGEYGLEIDGDQCGESAKSTKSAAAGPAGSTGAGPPFAAVSETTRALSVARPHCRGSSTPTPRCCSIYFLLWWALLQHLSFPFVLQITLHAAFVDAPNTTINIITAGNRANSSIDNNVHSGG